jgi:hypothetical protein
MRTKRLMTLLMATSLFILPAIATAGHKYSGNNNWPDQYARIAVKQAEKAYRRGCQVHGGRWTTDYRSHRRWASRNPVHKGEREIRRRDEVLRNCGQRYGGNGGSGGYDRYDNSNGRNNGYNQSGYDSREAFADYYATTAIKQARANIKRGCGYHGERWTTDYNSHYRYAYKTRRYRAESELQVRERMLNECQGRGRGH